MLEGRGRVLNPRYGAECLLMTMLNLELRLKKKRNQIPHTKTLKPKSVCTMLHIIKEIYLKEIKVVRCLRALKL